MLIDFSGLAPSQAYEWMSSLIVPRPIAWVSTVNADGQPNLAPFSFFQMVTGKPPTLLICPLLQRGGAFKHTLDNIRATGEFVVNLAGPAHAQALNATSATFGAEVDEFAACGVPSLPSSQVAPPRVADAPASFECRLAQIMPYPLDAPSCHLVFGQVLAAHVDEALLAPDGTLDPGQVDLLYRMGGQWYGRSRTDSNFTLPRPA